ncbi:MAG: cupin domain-containing protein [Solirubrobacteraceae bacterium]
MGDVRPRDHLSYLPVNGCRTQPPEEERMPFIHPYDLDGSTLRGEEYGASVSLILDESEPGQGPRLHRHAHDETWVIQEGTISLQVGEKRLTPGPGDIAIVPPGVPHKLTNDGPGRSKIVCIHASPTIIGDGLNNSSSNSLAEPEQ